MTQEQAKQELQERLEATERLLQQSRMENEQLRAKWLASQLST